MPKPKVQPPPPSELESITAAIGRISLRKDSTDANVRFLAVDDEPEYLPWLGSSRWNFESLSCIGEIPGSQATSLTKTFHRVSDILKEELSSFPNVEAFVHMTEHLESIQTELEELEQHRRDKKDADAILLPLSRLTWDKLRTQLGVKPPLLNQIDQTKMKLIVERAQKIYRQSHTKDLYNPNAWGHENVSGHLKFIEGLVLQRKEASARISIDRWVLELGKYLKDEMGWVVIIPEFTIQAARDGKATPSQLASIKYNNFNTTLTGVTDYAIIAQAYRDWDEGSFNLFKETATTAPSYNYLAEMLIGINIVVVEAKDVLTNKLEIHLPQVVGQCIALLSSAMNNRDPDRKAVPFFLTNGKIWIFGLVMSLATSSESSPLSDARPLYESFVFPPLDIIPADIHEPDNVADLRFNKYDTFVKMLLAWSKLKPHQLVQAIVEELGPHRDEIRG